MAPRLLLRRYAGLTFVMVSVAAWSSPVAVAESPDIPRTKATRIAANYCFSAEEHALLESIERGCFNFLWQEVGRPSGLVEDRRYGEVASLAGVGFQLSAIPIGVERGWITREEGLLNDAYKLRFLRFLTLD